MSCHVEFDDFECDIKIDETFFEKQDTTPDQKAILTCIKDVNEEGIFFNDISDISPRCKAMVNFCVDYLIFKRDNEDLFNKLSLKRHPEYASSLRKKKYINIWSFIFNFLRIDADSGYDYILMHFMEYHEIYVNNIRCGYFNTDDKHPYSDRILLKNRKDIIANWLKNAPDNIHPIQSDFTELTKMQKLHDIMNNPPPPDNIDTYYRWLGKVKSIERSYEYNDIRDCDTTIPFKANQIWQSAKIHENLSEKQHISLINKYCEDIKIEYLNGLINKSREKP
jgi:hypothetical protein